MTDNPSPRFSPDDLVPQPEPTPDRPPADPGSRSSDDPDAGRADTDARADADADAGRAEGTDTGRADTEADTEADRVAGTHVDRPPTAAPETTPTPAPGPSDRDRAEPTAHVLAYDDRERRSPGPRPRSGAAGYIPQLDAAPTPDPYEPILEAAPPPEDHEPGNGTAPPLGPYLPQTEPGPGAGPYGGLALDTSPAAGLWPPPPVAVDDLPREPPEPRLDLGRVWTVARADLRQLAQARDFLYPMIGLGSLFYVIIPAILLLAITSIGSVEVVGRVSEALEALPDSAESQIRGETPEAQTAFALAVFLFAPVAVIVPLTISTAVGAATLVGERERGTGEFLAHSPASVREVYLGKLVASLIPGYLTVVVGFGAYSLLVNTIVGPSVGGWFFPTTQWWIMILWVLPPFLAICLSIVLRLSARVSSTAAAQQASGLVSLPLIMVAYSQATGVLFGAGALPYVVGALAWVGAIFSLRRGMRAVRRDRLLSVASGI